MEYQSGGKTKAAVNCAPISPSGGSSVTSGIEARRAAKAKFSEDDFKAAEDYAAKNPIGELFALARLRDDAE